MDQIEEFNKKVTKIKIKTNVTVVAYCASVAMDSPSASPAKAESSVYQATQEEAGPCPRFVTSEELNILQTCLTRWRTEVEQDIKGISSFISDFFVFILWHDVHCIKIDKAVPWNTFKCLEMLCFGSVVNTLSLFTVIYNIVDMYSCKFRFWQLHCM